MSGAELIAAERQRQKDVEGWTPEHDDEHDNTEMLFAAVEYVQATQALVLSIPDATFGASWPWHPSWWKPSDDPIRNLEKAGALIAAEIDRLQRMRGES